MNILVTGGASGIGGAISEKLASAQNNRVFITYNSSIEKAKELESKFPNLTSIKCDFTNSADLEGLAARLPGSDIDVLVNNAVTGLIEKHFHKIAPGDFLASFKNNVLPTIILTQAAISLFRKKKSGKIITLLTSYLVNRPPTGLSEYVANKAYLESLSKSWASENASFNITSNCVAPSFVRTSLTKYVDERVVEQITAQQPRKKLLTPAEIADTVCFLADCSAHINGISLIMNGGSDVV